MKKNHVMYEESLAHRTGTPLKHEQLSHSTIINFQYFFCFFWQILTNFF